jgi:hypothetical protein
MSGKGKEALQKLLEEALTAPLDFDYDRLGSFGEWKDFPVQDQKLCLIDQNDLGNAARLINRYGKNLIFIAESGWYAWTGKYWSRDEGEKILQLCAQKTVKKMKGEIFARVAKGQHDGISPKEIKELFKIYCRFRISSGNTNRIAAIGIEARPHLTRSKDDLDTHPFLLNVQNGTLNLKARIQARKISTALCWKNTNANIGSQNWPMCFTILMPTPLSFINSSVRLSRTMKSVFSCSGSLAIA